MENDKVHPHFFSPLFDVLGSTSLPKVAPRFTQQIELHIRTRREVSIDTPVTNLRVLRGKSADELDSYWHIDCGGKSLGYHTSQV